MTTKAIELMTLGLYNRKTARRSATLDKGDVEVLKGLGGQTLRCTAGTLWLTMEGDRKDYILTQNQAVAIPNLGKVVVTGSGSYQAL
jgi:hypothetical protein